jgi:hypothetical protein
MINFWRILAMRRISWLVFLAISLVPLDGCAGTTDRRWSEEVLLSDGSVIVVDRFVKFQSSNSLAGDAYSSTDLKSTLTFTKKLSSTAAWDAPLVPIVLYRDETTKELVIVATTGNCDTWYQLGSPVPPYWEYRLQGNKWIKMKTVESSFGRKANLFFNYESALPAQMITSDIKDHVIASHDFAKDFLSVDQGAKGCTPRN